MSTESILRVKGLRARFGNSTPEVLHGVDIEIARGEIVGIVGESGSGKSVSALSIPRLIPSPLIDYSAGSIHFEGVDMLSADEATQRNLRGPKIAVIFQEPMSALNPVKRCGAQVAEMIQNHEPKQSQHEVKARILHLFDQVKLPEPERAYQAYPHELSGGQMQRVMIAMAIACEPDLLIADEPTTALDVTVQREIMDLLKSLQANMGMAILFISHDLGLVGHICHRILVMYKGAIVEQGKALSLLLNPTHPYTQGLLASRPPHAGRPARLRTVQDVLDGKEAAEQVPTASRAQHLATLSESPTLLRCAAISVHYPVKGGLLRKTIREIIAVDQVDVQLRKGETLGVVGESGCGKSTLSKAIMGMVPLQQGEIYFEEKAWFDIAPLERARRVQMIFQDPYSSLDPRQSIGSAIMEPMQVHKLHEDRQTRRKEAIRLLEEVGLSADQFDRYPHEFSGGQRQRIGIARALAVEPKVIICDESVSALDVSVQAQVLNLLNELKVKYGLSYIFISHDLSVVRYMSDHLMVMKAGQVVEYGESDQIYRSPTHPYTQRLIDSSYVLDSSPA